jgi:hypothetical protein
LTLAVKLSLDKAKLTHLTALVYSWRHRQSAIKQSLKEAPKYSCSNDHPSASAKAEKIFGADRRSIGKAVSMYVSDPHLLLYSG